MKTHLRITLVAIVVTFIINSVPAEVSVPAIFGDNMVFQMEQQNPVWGWANPGETVYVRIDGQKHKTKADNNGNWKVKIGSLPVGGPYTLEIKGENKLVFEDVLSGEVWLCSGQSNMQWSVSQIMDGDLEILLKTSHCTRLTPVYAETLPDHRCRKILQSPSLQ